MGDDVYLMNGKPLVYSQVERLLEPLYQKIGIVELVSELVPLHQLKHFVTKCPFHLEGDLFSLQVDGENESFLCEFCLKHGNIAEFVMSTKNIGFEESIKYLYNRVGLTLGVVDE